MAIYIVCMIFPLLSAVIEYKNRQLGKVLFSCGLLLLFSVSALRSFSVGTDTSNYLYAYNNLSISHIRNSFELGWYSLMWICRNVFNSYRLVLMLTSFLIIIFVRKSICQVSRNWNLSLYYFVVFYFYFQSFNIMRQMLAAAIVLYAFTFIEKKKILPYVLYIFIAASFHMTALFALPMYYISKIRCYPILYVALLILSFIVAPRIMPYVLDVVGNIEMYEIYTYVESKGSSYISMNLLLHSCVAVILIFDKKKESWLSIFFIGLLLTNLLSLFETLGRIGIYMKMAIILIIPNMYIQIANIKLNTVVHICIALLLFISCIVMLASNTQGVYPYSFL